MLVCEMTLYALIPGKDAAPSGALHQGAAGLGWAMERCSVTPASPLSARGAAASTGVLMRVC